MWLLLGLNISESEQSVRCSHVGTQPMARVSLDSVNSGCSQLISALTASPQNHHGAQTAQETGVGSCTHPSSVSPAA